jgi:uncharacterized protein YqeY
MLVDQIKTQIIEAMKARDEIRVSTLKMLSSALTNAEIAKKREKLTEEEELKVVRSEAKKRSDAIEMYKKANEVERADKENKELKILQEFLPEELSNEELEIIVKGSIEQSGAKSMTDMGKVMGMVVKKVEGRADGKRISEIVRSLLTQ